MGLSDLLRGLTGRNDKDKPVPATEALPRMRESSGKFQAIRPPPAAQPTPKAQPVVGEPTPATGAPAVPKPIMPPAWSDVFPAHHKALISDLQKRGEDPARWEVQDGRDLGVTEAGHTVAFRAHKTGTSVTIQVELTLFKGRLASVRVR